jgi:1,6-anhydro-N-acetylmuramate kinase
MLRRLIVGCMTGTSLDGIDAALVEVLGVGLNTTARFLRGTSLPLGTCSATLRALADQHPVTAAQIASATHDFALLHARAIKEVAADIKLDLACIHGQTVYHKPPASWQLLQPAPIARAIHAPIVYDLRAADLAAGGQGAPITPIADAVLFSDDHAARVVLNLGGFANFTLLPAGAARAPHSIRGGDICACNQLLDAVARATLHKPFDEDGAVAATGTPDAALLTSLSALLTRQSSGQRSLGTGDELMDWVAANSRSPAISPATLGATAIAALSSTIAARLQRECAAANITSLDAVIVAGGSVRNAALMSALAAACPARITQSEEFGVPAAFREAVCFAVLGALCQDRVPITLPAITHCPAPAPIAGAWVFP